MPDADKAALEARLKKLGATDRQWLDISLVKIVGDVETKIKALDSPLRFTVEIPKETRGTNRTYYLIRLHDGEASVIASGASTVLAAKTDRFSPYVLAFKEPSADPGKQSKDPVKRQEPESPKSSAPAANRVSSSPAPSSKDSSRNASKRTVTTTQQSKSTAISLPRTGDSMFEHSVLLLAA